MTGKKRKRSSLARLGLAARAGRTALSTRLASLDLHAGQDAVLLALDAENGLALRELAARLAVRPPTVTKTIARLAAHGLVEKRGSASDARRAHAFLTPAGRALVAKVRAAQDAVEAAALADFSNGETKTLRRLLRRVERNLAAASGAGRGPGTDGTPDAEDA